MALTVTAGIQVIEATIPGGYRISLADPKGNQFHHSQGATRELAVLGLANYGYTVEDKE